LKGKAARRSAQRSGSIRPAADGEAGEAGYVVDIQPIHDLGAVGFDGFGADAQALGDLAGRGPRRSVAGFRAGGGSATRGWPTWACFLASEPQVFVQQVARYRRAEPTLAFLDRPQRPLHLIDGRVLDHVTGGAGPQRLQHVVSAVCMDRITTWVGGVSLTISAVASNPFNPGMADVEQRDIRLQFPRQMDRLAPIAGFGDHAKPLERFHQFAQTRSHQDMIIGQQHSNLS
jgi:hypothetical protein